ncbi:hypothetical protein SESBI_50233 [Sesbania bispinosa]|nr:hypothetical protein SESBI_50233 [Sesbania bispinosa]
MEESLQALIKKADENGHKPRNGENLDANKGRSLNASTKTDWDNIKLEPFQKDVDTGLFMDLSDDDGYFHEMGSRKNKMKMPRQTTEPPQQLTTTGQSFKKTEFAMYHSVGNGLNLRALASEFMRGSILQSPSGTKDSSTDVNSSLMPRKLSFAPHTAGKKPKIINVEDTMKCTPRKRVGWKERNIKGSIRHEKNATSAGNGANTNPKPCIRTKFMPHLDMKLTPQEVHLSLYMFHVEGEPGEPLVKIGASIGTRRELETLCPDKGVVREVLSNMVASPTFPAELFSPYYEMELWDIKKPEGMPKCANGDNSAIWVLDWMSMADAFTANVSPQMNEKNVRMRVAIDLVQGDHNEYLGDIHGKAEAFWQRMRNPKQE